MDVTLWGTRGTFPVPGPSTVRYGGDTTCLSVETANEVLVIDCGTGIRALGEAIAGDGRPVTVLFTHIHADHVMGFPFFSPLYDDGRSVHVLDHRLGDVAWSATALLDGVHFPLTPDQLPCALQRITEDAPAFFESFGIAIRRTRLNHPGGAYGYRIEDGDRSLVFIPDNELLTKGKPIVTFEEVADFCAGADVLIHDAQYTPLEFEARGGWGHSTYNQACDLAVAANVKKLVLTHHDPARSDNQLDVLLDKARDRLGTSAHVDVQMAADRMKFRL